MKFTNRILVFAIAILAATSFSQSLRVAGETDIENMVLTLYEDGMTSDSVISGTNCGFRVWTGSGGSNAGVYDYATLTGEQLTIGGKTIILYPLAALNDNGAAYGADRYFRFDSTQLPSSVTQTIPVPIEIKATYNLHFNPNVAHAAGAVTTGEVKVSLSPQVCNRVAMNSTNWTGGASGANAWVPITIDPSYFWSAVSLLMVGQVRANMPGGIPEIPNANLQAWREDQFGVLLPRPTVFYSASHGDAAGMFGKSSDIDPDLLVSWARITNYVINGRIPGLPVNLAILDCCSCMADNGNSALHAFWMVPPGRTQAPSTKL